MAPAAQRKRPSAGPTFVTPLTVQDYTSNDINHEPFGMSKQQSFCQDEFDTTSMYPASLGSWSMTSPSPIGGTIRPSATEKSIRGTEDRRHTTAERRHRDSVQRSYQDLCQCLTHYGLLTSPRQDSASESGGNGGPLVHKGRVLTAAVSAINKLRQQEKDLDELIQRQESHVRAAYLSLRMASCPAEPQKDMAASNDMDSSDWRQSAPIQDPMTLVMFGSAMDQVHA